MPNTITIQLDPLDTLFFKDGKPFSMGEETWADGIFPPPPSVLYGAIRTALISEQMGDTSLEDLISQTKNLVISNLAFNLGEGSDDYYPLPFDVVTYKDKDPEKDNYTVFPLPIKPVNLLSGSGFSVFPMYDRDDNQTVENIKGGLISRTNLIKYLKGSYADFKCKNWSDFMTEEPKVGIKRNRSTRTTSEADGELYRVGMKRMKRRAQFQVTIKWERGLFPFLTGGNLIRLGAEGKMTRVFLVENATSFIAKLTTRYIRVYLATDGVFENGIPDLFRYGISAKLVGMATGKPFMLGGFDMVTMKPKPMLKVAPAGSVFYFETDAPVDVSSLQGLALSDSINGMDYARQGFGIAYFGTWKPQD